MGYQGSLGGVLRLRRFSTGWVSLLVIVSVFLVWRGYRGSHSKYK